ncbi:hypothetical protein CRUP_031527, partial [Coryphaenoides rupestris]
VCNGGLWKCVEKDCPGTCSVEGGAHINTFDGKVYSFHGDCTYTLTRDCTTPRFTVLVELVIKILAGADLSIYHLSSTYMLVHTNVGLQLMVQLTPVMQIFVTLDKSLSGTTCERFAEYWCSKIVDPKGPFASCHPVIDPTTYKANCKYDSCNCENNEACMCAAVSSYVYACSLEGVHFKGWRKSICDQDARGGTACGCEMGHLMNERQRMLCEHQQLSLLRPGGTSSNPRRPTCTNRRFKCTNNVCDEVCSIYGDGHYTTFDEKKFDFSGQCEYTLVEANEFQLTDGEYALVKGRGKEFPIQVRKMGLYMVVELKKGVVLMWDQKTSLFIRVSATYQVVDILDFGNSWKVSGSCPDAQQIRNPCNANPYRAAWSQKQCSIINSVTFQSCHSKVDPDPYFQGCVTDSCACDTGGDCECFCTAVASYAKACTEAGACVRWRTPKICPLFCDYYNYPMGCEWHYKPCGAPCMKTCRNPTGNCSSLITGLEGCYPNCPPTSPFFDEDNMKCVPINQCGCYDVQGNHYATGAVIPSDNCHYCTAPDEVDLRCYGIRRSPQHSF